MTELGFGTLEEGELIYDDRTMRLFIVEKKLYSRDWDWAGEPIDRDYFALKPYHGGHFSTLDKYSIQHYHFVDHTSPHEILVPLLVSRVNKLESKLNER